jgi:geranylgeranyl transferase type-2 subunit alpha
MQITVGGVRGSCPVQSDWPKSLWRCPLSDDVILSDEEEVPVTIDLDELKDNLSVRKCSGSSDEGVRWLGGRGPMFGSTLTAATSSVLTAELDNCKELLQMEPDNKWCILTTLLLLQELDWLNNQQQITDMFDKLCNVDPYRHGYYQDMRSRFLVECSLVAACLNGLSSSSPQSLDLSGKSLSRLYHSEHMCHLRTLDLSHNQLTALNNVDNLVCLETLTVDDNKLKELPPGMEKLQMLRVLSIRNNKLSDPKQLRCVKVVKVLRLQGNPLCESGDWKEVVEAEVPGLQELNGHTGTAQGSSISCS